MGNGMDKILPGLYVGNIRDSKDETQLTDNRITHILSIHDNAKPMVKGKKYLCIAARDNSDQDLLQYFPQCNDFIHDARVTGGAVLVHCLAGVSRSVTVTVAYIMTVTSLEWRDALNAVRGARRCANPNFGFQRQLVAFQHEHLHIERARFRGKEVATATEDEAECRRLIEVHSDWVINGDAPDCDKNYPLPHNAYAAGKAGQSSAAETSSVAEEVKRREARTGGDSNDGNANNTKNDPSVEPSSNATNNDEEQETANVMDDSDELVDEMFLAEGRVDRKRKSEGRTSQPSAEGKL